MVYDAGNFQDDGATCVDAVEELIPEGDAIDLMILSHSDADHLGGVDEILDDYTVRRIIHGGKERTTVTWAVAFGAIAVERELEDAVVVNLSHDEFPVGATYRIGDAFVTMLAGFGEPPEDWNLEDESEENNAGSIVVRLQYAGRSVLYAGDAVGRHIGDLPTALIATEEFLIEMSKVLPLDSDVVIAPHHGADNGSSTAFIQATSPQFVIFSAGHRFEHPRGDTVQRYLANGVLAENIFRTDRGDDEGDDEWDGQRIPGTEDIRGDDDVEITLRASGTIQVRYLNP